MTEQEWLNAVDPEAMLMYLEGRISDRRCWLFVAACYRRVFPVLHVVRRNAEGQAHLRRTVELYERVADGLATEAENRVLYPPDASGVVAFGSTLASSLNAADEVRAGKMSGKRFWNRTAERRAAAQRSAREKAFAAERAVQSGLLRCLVGNPFHPVPALSYEILSWNGRTIAKIAEAIYTEYAFDRLFILADALEEAGCTDADILTHCRQPSEHARGCWVVDRILGKS